LSVSSIVLKRKYSSGAEGKTSFHSLGVISSRELETFTVKALMIYPSLDLVVPPGDRTLNGHRFGGKVT